MLAPYMEKAREKPIAESLGHVEALDGMNPSERREPEKLLASSARPFLLSRNIVN